MPAPDNSFDIKNWLDRILNTGSKELGDSTVPAKLLNGPLSHEIPLKLGQLSFTIVPEAEATIVLFNSKDDLNQDPMEGVIAAGEDPDAVPPIKFSADGAWLAYHATAGVKADGGGDVERWACISKARRRYNCATTTFIPTVRRRSRMRFPPISRRWDSPSAHQI